MLDRCRNRYFFLFDIVVISVRVVASTVLGRAHVRQRLCVNGVFFASIRIRLGYIVQRNPGGRYTKKVNRGH